MAKFDAPLWLPITLMTIALGVAVWAAVMLRRSYILVTVAVLVVLGAVATVMLRNRSEFRSVVDLVAHVEDRGPDCGGALEVSAGQVGGDGPYVEVGQCERFDGDDVADFYWFPDHDARGAYVAYQRALAQEWEFDGVVGPNWFVSVRSEDTARDIQDAVGGQLSGY